MSKRLLAGSLLSLILTSGVMCYAEDLNPANEQTEQSVKNQQSYFTANLQKTPQNGKQKQGITNHFTFFTINVQVNGKIKEEK